MKEQKYLANFVVKLRVNFLCIEFGSGRSVVLYSLDIIDITSSLPYSLKQKVCVDEFRTKNFDDQRISYRVDVSQQCFPLSRS